MMEVRLVRLCGLVLSIVLSVALLGCSTTQSESRGFLAVPKSVKVSSYKMHVSGFSVRRALQVSGHVFELHARPKKLVSMLRGTAASFGFQAVSLNEADYHLKLMSVYPDGGACQSVQAKAGAVVSYFFSALTLGLLPSTFVHCYEVSVELWERIDDEWLLIEKFSSNEGRVRVFGGINDVYNYHEVVTVRDEDRAVEASMSQLMYDMLVQGAFE